MLLEFGIDVLFPVELVDQVIDVVVVGIGDVFDQQLPGHAPAFDHRLVHAEDVRTPLRLISQQRARGVEDARRDQPAGAGLETISLGVVEDPVIALVPPFEAAMNVGLGRARLESHERVRERGCRSS